MPVYLVAQLCIHDRETYAKYGSAFMDMSNPYGGKLLSVEEAPEVLEGESVTVRATSIALSKRPGMRRLRTKSLPVPRGSTASSTGTTCRTTATLARAATACACATWRTCRRAGA